ncbi:MAG: hypothetical protein ACFFD4_02080 [Candidatus Odinarchaeota archaeon]
MVIDPFNSFHKTVNDRPFLSLVTKCKKESKINNGQYVVEHEIGRKTCLLPTISKGMTSSKRTAAVSQRVAIIPFLQRFQEIIIHRSRVFIGEVLLGIDDR